MLEFKCGFYFGTSEVLNLPQHIDSVTMYWFKAAPLFCPFFKLAQVFITC